MATIKFDLNEKKHGAFTLLEGEKKIGEMVVSIHDHTLTVYHTEVAAEEEGKGYAKKLLDEMIGYVRSHQLRVIPLCPYVLAQFKRHADEYADVWVK